jgi:hypothetical protein
VWSRMNQVNSEFTKTKMRSTARTRTWDMVWSVGGGQFKLFYKKTKMRLLPERCDDTWDDAQVCGSVEEPGQTSVSRNSSIEYEFYKKQKRNTSHCCPAATTHGRAGVVMEVWRCGSN